MTEYIVHVVATNRSHGGVSQYQIPGFTNKTSAQLAVDALRNSFYSNSNVNVVATVIGID